MAVKKTSLKGYIFTSFVITVFIVNTIFFLIYFLISVNGIKQEAKNYIISIGKPITFSLSSLSKENDETLVKIILASLYSNRFIDNVMLFDRAGSFMYGGNSEDRDDRGVVRKLIEENKLIIIEQYGSLLYFAFPVYGSNYYDSFIKDLQAVLFIKTDIGNFLKDSKELIFSVLGINILISALLILFFMIILQHYIFLPLKHLQEATDKISNGNYVEIEGEGRFEFKNIFDSFNRMSNNLDFYTTRLEILNRSLANEVEERTAELRLLKDRFQDIAESVGDILWETDRNMRFVFSSAGVFNVLGYNVDEVIGKPFSFSFDTESKESLKELLENVCKNQIPFSFQCHNVTKDGRGVILQVSGKPFFVNGEFAGFRGVSKDITKESELQRNLQRVQRIDSLGTLVSGIAHDFNNIINVIQNFTDLLIKQFSETGGRELTFLKEIRKATHRGSTLIRKLLVFTRKSTVRRVRINPGEQIKNLKGFLTRIIGKGIKIVLDIKKEDCVVLMDPTEFDQVMVNLAINARDAMPNGGEIVIEVYSKELERGDFGNSLEPGLYCVMEFRDTGEGIESEELEKIFEPFYTTKDKGTGLGLAIVFAILRQSGGHVEVESKRGEGTRFILYIPAVKNAVAQSTPMAEDKVVTLGVGYDVVVIDDDPQSLRAIVEMLKELKCNVKSRSSCRNISPLLKEKVDLFVIDLEMPNVKGEDCIEKIRGVDEEVKILVVSGFLTNSRLKNVIKLGANDYLEKPFGLNELSSKIAKMLEG